MPPKTASGTAPKPRKVGSKAKKTFKAHQALPLRQIDQKEESPTPRENSLYMLANEIIAMIFKQLGKPPQDGLYVVEDLQNIHPCYAICSTSNFLKQWYTKIMGEASNKIELTLQPTDYMDTEEDVERAIKNRLRLLGHEGLRRVSKCHIIGSKISRNVGKPALSRWLNSAHPTKRLEPEDKVRIKLHVERDLVRKTTIVKNLMMCVYNLFKELETLRISPGELPFNVWDEAVHQYILKEPKALTEFKYVQRSETAWKKNYWYIEQLTNIRFFPNRDEQPKNYPATPHINKAGFAELQTVISNLLNAKISIKKHEVCKDIRIHDSNTGHLSTP